jgi:hypothetical protein
MIIPPEYDPDMIKFWLGLGNKIYFHLRGTGGNDNEIYAHYLMKLLPMAYVFSPEIKNPIRAGIFNCGCVANQELLAASTMGCNPLYLCGVNFGYPMNKAHIKPQIYDGEKWIDFEYQKDFANVNAAQFESDHGVLTDVTNVMYKNATIMIWSQTLADMYEVSVDELWGILDLIPKIDLKALAAGINVEHKKVSIEDRMMAVSAYREAHGYKPIEMTEAGMIVPKEDDGIKTGEYAPEQPGERI